MKHFLLKWFNFHWGAAYDAEYWPNANRPDLKGQMIRAYKVCSCGIKEV